MKTTKYMLIVCLLVAIASCSQKQAQKTSCFNLNPTDFQKTIGRKQTNLYFLQNGDLSAAITNYGGRIVGLCVPERRGEMAKRIPKCNGRLDA